MVEALFNHGCENFTALDIGWVDSFALSYDLLVSELLEGVKIDSPVCLVLADIEAFLLDGAGCLLLILLLLFEQNGVDIFVLDLNRETSLIFRIKQSFNVLGPKHLPRILVDRQ